MADSPQFFSDFLAPEALGLRVGITVESPRTHVYGALVCMWATVFSRASLVGYSDFHDP